MYLQIIGVRSSNLQVSYHLYFLHLNSYLHSYSTYRNLHKDEDHPVAMVTKQLCSLLAEKFGVHHVEMEDFSIVCDSADINMTGKMLE